MKGLDDLQLLLLIRKENDAAFQEVYDRYWAGLYNSAFKRLKNAHLAEEVVQETFLNLYTKRASVQISSSLSPYLFSVLKFKVIDEIRKQISVNTYQQHVAGLPFASDLNGQELLEKKEVKDQFDHFYDTLPKKCREVFLLKQDELSNQAIARELNISEKTVEGHVSKARRLLKSYMGDLYLGARFWFMVYLFIN